MRLSAKIWESVYVNINFNIIMKLNNISHGFMANRNNLTGEKVEDYSFLKMYNYIAHELLNSDLQPRTCTHHTALLALCQLAHGSKTEQQTLA